MGTFSNNARKDYHINLSFGDFRDEDDFFDVTLAAESSDGTIKGLRAHKLIISACSPVLRTLLKEQARLTSNSKMMPVMLYLRGISARGLGHVLDFIYKGTINLAQEELNDFLAVGESLQIPLIERPKPGPAKRAPPAPKSVEKSKRARVVLPRVLPMEHEAPPPETTEELSLSKIKPDPGSAAAPSEDMCEGDVADEASEQNLYDGGENDNAEPEDDYQDDSAADPAPEEQQPFAGPSDGTPTEYDLTVDGGHTLTMDELLQNYVQPCDGGSICLICRKKLLSKEKRYLSNVKRHMQDMHLSCEGAYYCPPCDKKFKNKTNMYQHIRNKHKHWKGVNVADFEVMSKSQ